MCRSGVSQRRCLTIPAQEEGAVQSRQSIAAAGTSCEIIAAVIQALHDAPRP
jgi:hypothetical protein